MLKKISFFIFVLIVVVLLFMTMLFQPTRSTYAAGGTKTQTPTVTTTHTVTGTSTVTPTQTATYTPTDVGYPAPGTPIPTQPPLPTETPAPTWTPGIMPPAFIAVEFVYLPIVMKEYESPHYNVDKGIAMVSPSYQTDLAEMGASWYYTWSPLPDPDSQPSNYAEYVPMSYYGLYDTNLMSTSYDDFVLFLNEPNNVAPYGSDVSPTTAAQRYVAFINAYPNAKLVVGNCSAWASTWYRDFLIALNTSYPSVAKPQYYGIHGYIESYITTSYLDTWWSAIYSTIVTYSGITPTIWVTEFADTTGDTVSYVNLLNLIESKTYITRFSHFTNRYDPSAPYIPSTWYDFGLWENGVISPIGEIYRVFP